MPASIELRYSELQCAICGVVQRNKLRSAGSRTLCLNCGTASSTASWHPIGEPRTQNTSDPYSPIRWVTVHLADRSPWARRFALEISKHLLALGFVVYEFISQELQAALRYKEALGVFAGANGNLIVGEVHAVIAAYQHTCTLIENGQMALKIPFTYEGRTVLVAPELIDLLKAWRSDPVTIARMEEWHRERPKSKGVEDVDWSSQQLSHSLPGARPFVVANGQWTPAFCYRIARAVSGSRLLFRSVTTPAAIELIREANAKLLERLSRRLVTWEELSWQQIEEIVAELFAGLGYTVDLHRQPKDGGVDIVVIRKSDIFKPDELLVQIKHWRQPVGIDVVKLLHGEVVRRSSTRGIVATTSWFTRDAKEFLDTYRWQIEGKDRDDLLDWTKKYMARKPTRA